MVSILIVGNGNVAFHLKNQFDQIDDLNCTQISSRNITTTPVADIAIIAVSDDAIAQVSSFIKTSLVVHTSGAQPMNVLKNKGRKGVFYPLQSFSKSKEVNFKKIPICLETETEEDYLLLEKLANSISKNVNRISSKQREMIHIAAVFANNFTNHMLSISKDICDTDNIPFDILEPLIQETLNKIKELSPKEAQTGPAIRRDEETMKKHLFLLPGKYQSVYKIISDSIQYGD